MKWINYLFAATILINLYAHILNSDTNLIVIGVWIALIGYEKIPFGNNEMIEHDKLKSYMPAFRLLGLLMICLGTLLLVLGI